MSMALRNIGCGTASEEFKVRWAQDDPVLGISETLRIPNTEQVSVPSRNRTPKPGENPKSGIKKARGANSGLFCFHRSLAVGPLNSFKIAKEL